jgi:hypothetical protein
VSGKACACGACCEVAIWCPELVDTSPCRGSVSSGIGGIRITACEAHYDPIVEASRRLAPSPGSRAARIREQAMFTHPIHGSHLEPLEMTRDQLARDGMLILSAAVRRAMERPGSPPIGWVDLRLAHAWIDGLHIASAESVGLRS